MHLAVATKYSAYGATRASTMSHPWKRGSQTAAQVYKRPQYADGFALAYEQDRRVDGDSRVTC